MANLFQDNAYNILGLDTSATQKDINKRAKEIINFLRIDKESNYETDLNLVEVNRKENTVKNAVQKLSSPTKRIKEYFFWFDVENDIDEKAIKLIKEKNIDDAIELWEFHAAKGKASGYVAKKNLAILSSLLLLSTGQKKYLNKSLGYWEDIILVDKFWTYFEKIYALNDEVGTSKAALNDFSKKATDDLSDFYTDVSEQYKDKSFYAQFSALFAVKGQRVQEDVLDPIYASINDISEKLLELNVSEDGILSEDELKTIKSYIRKLQDNFKDLEELGLYGDSQSKIMRDKAANSIRFLVLDINNNLDDTVTAIGLLGVAVKFAGTEGQKTRLKQDMSDLKKLHQDKKLNNEISDTVEAAINYHKQGEATQAMSVLDEKLSDENLSEEAADILLNFKNKIEGDLNTFGKPVSKAPSMYTFNTIGTKIYGDTLYFVVFFIPLLPLARYSVEKVGDGQYQFYGKLPLTTGKKWWLGIVVAIAALFTVAILLSGSSYDSGTPSDSSSSSSGSSSSTGSSSDGNTSPNSAYQTCSDQYDNLKSQLDSIESTMNQYKAAGSTDSYNALVPQQNSLADQLNAKATECNGLR